jgi:hypothetical protein
MVHVRSIAGAIGLICASLSQNVPAWHESISGEALESEDEAVDVVLDEAGDVLAAGSLQREDLGSDFSVYKLDGGTGEPIWQVRLNGDSLSGENGAESILVDANGDALAAGYLSIEGRGHSFTVTKINGSSGEILWTQMLDGLPKEAADKAYDAGIDGDNNVVAVGYFANASSGTDIAAVKLSGATGDILWRKAFNGPSMEDNAAFAVSLDEADNLLFAGQMGNTYDGAWISVLKLRNLDGELLWDKDLWGGDVGRDGWATEVGVDAQQNVVVVGTLPHASSRSFYVAKLRGLDGTLMWEQDFFGGATFGYNCAADFAFDQAGNLFVASVTDDISGWRFAVVKLNGNDGSKIWPPGLGTSPLPYIGASAEAIAIDDAGDVVAVGQTPSLMPSL